MKTFLETLDSLPTNHWQDLTRCEDEQRVLNFIHSNSNLNPIEKFAALLSPAADKHLETMAQKAAALTAQRFGKAIRFYAPMYISNECTNTCTYCGFTMENKMVRKSLNAEEAEAEVRYLYDRGFRHILIVSGEHQKIVTPEYIGMMVDICRKYFPSVTIEVAPFSIEDYEGLVAKGVDGLTVYQETYDRETYKEVHLRGKKKDFEWRITSAERGAMAKMRRLNIGVLLGLAEDWRFDSVMNAAHLDFMMKNYWRVQYSISLPRLCESEADYEVKSVVSDRQLTQLMLAYRLAFPDLGINVSTREPATLRDGLLGLGVTQMSAESATEPGGYCQPSEALKQFDITDERKVDEIFPVLKSRGLEPVWKDWEACMLG